MTGINELHKDATVFCRGHFQRNVFLKLPAVLLLAACCQGQVTKAPVLKASDLQADEAILRSAYEQLHPGLYRYNSKAQMDADFGVLHHQLDHDQTLQDAFLAFSEFAAKVGSCLA